MFDALWQQPDMRKLLACHDIAGVFRVLGEAGISQRRLGALTGQSQSEISEILAGRQVRSYDVLVRVAFGLGIPRGLMGLAFVPAGEQPDPWAPSDGRVVTWTAAEIRRLRMAMRLSVRGFGMHLGVSHRQVSKWEAGAMPGPASRRALDYCLRMAEPGARMRFFDATGPLP